MPTIINGTEYGGTGIPNSFLQPGSNEVTIGEPIDTSRFDPNFDVYVQTGPDSIRPIQQGETLPANSNLVINTAPQQTGGGGGGTGNPSIDAAGGLDVWQAVQDANARVAEIEATIYGIDSANYRADVAARTSTANAQLAAAAQTQSAQIGAAAQTESARIAADASVKVANIQREVQYYRAGMDYLMQSRQFGFEAASQELQRRIYNADQSYREALLSLEGYGLRLEQDRVQAQMLESWQQSAVALVDLFSSRAGPQDWVAYSFLVNNFAQPEAEASQELDIFSILGERPDAPVFDDIPTDFNLERVQQMTPEEYQRYIDALQADSIPGQPGFFNQGGTGGAPGEGGGGQQQPTQGIRASTPGPEGFAPGATGGGGQFPDLQAPQMPGAGGAGMLPEPAIHPSVGGDGGQAWNLLPGTTQDGWVYTGGNSWIGPDGQVSTTGPGEPAPAPTNTTTVGGVAGGGGDAGGGTPGTNRFGSPQTGRPIDWAGRYIDEAGNVQQIPGHTSAQSFAQGGQSDGRVIMVGDSESGRETGHEELVFNPTNAPLTVIPNDVTDIMLGREVPRAQQGGQFGAQNFFQQPAQANRPPPSPFQQPPASQGGPQGFFANAAGPARSAADLGRSAPAFGSNFQQPTGQQRPVFEQTPLANINPAFQQIRNSMVDMAPIWQQIAQGANQFGQGFNNLQQQRQTQTQNMPSANPPPQPAPPPSPMQRRQADQPRPQGAYTAGYDLFSGGGRSNPFSGLFSGGIPRFATGGSTGFTQQNTTPAFVFSQYTPETLGQQPFIQTLQGQRDAPSFTGFGTPLTNPDIGINTPLPAVPNLQQFLNLRPSEQQATQSLYEQGHGVSFPDIAAMMQRAAPIGMQGQFPARYGG